MIAPVPVHCLLGSLIVAKSMLDIIHLLLSEQRHLWCTGKLLDLC